MRHPSRPCILRESQRGKGSIIERIAWTAGLVLLFVGGYFGLAAWRMEAEAVSLALPLDADVPLVVRSVWLYTTAYTAPLLPLFLEREPGRFRRIGRAYACVLLLCFAGFALLPVHTGALRPPAEAVAGPGLDAWLLRTIYRLDPPGNAFPSVHVAVGTLVALVLQRALPRSAPLAWLWWSALVASTLLTRQHFAADAAAGGVLGLAVGAVLLPPRHDGGARARRGLLGYAALHLAAVACAALVHTATRGAGPPAAPVGLP